MSEDYDKGWKDGFNAAIDTLQRTVVPQPQPKEINICTECRVDLTTMSRYVCYVVDCPKQVRWENKTIDPLPKIKIKALTLDDLKQQIKDKQNEL